MEKNVKKGIPSFFNDIEVLETLDLNRIKAQYKEEIEAIANKITDIEVSVNEEPTLIMSKNTKKIYQNKDYNAIKSLENKVQKDLDPLYENIKSYQENAWTKVRYGDKEFYMSWNEHSSVWVYIKNTLAIQKDNGEITYQPIIQYGTYTESGNICGIHSYNLTMETMISEAIISAILAVALSKMIEIGLEYTVTAFSLALANAASRLGFTSFRFLVSPAAISSVAFSIAFVVIFIGLTYLWDILNRKYTVQLKVFNWDENYNWLITDNIYNGNAVIKGESTFKNIQVSRMKKKGDIVMPPGFQPVEILDEVCHYATIIWENDNTFLEGCSMALQFVRPVLGGVNSSFTWAFSCPRFSDNKHKADSGLIDPETYINDYKWNDSPLNFSINCGVPVNFLLNALSGAEDNKYDIIINLSQK